MIVPKTIRMRDLTATTLILIGSVAAIGCHKSKAPRIDMEATPRPIAAGTRSSSAPRLGLWVPNTVFALTVAGDDSHSRLQLQFSRNGGDTFDKPIDISDPQARVRAGGENSPVLFTDVQGDIYAAWFQTWEGATQLMIREVDSPKSGKPVNVLDLDRNSEAYAGFPTLAGTHKGDVYAAWLDERDKGDPEGSSSVYFARSADHGATFSRNMRISTAACAPLLFSASKHGMFRVIRCGKIV